MRIKRIVTFIILALPLQFLARCEYAIWMAAPGSVIHVGWLP